MIINSESSQSDWLAWTGGESTWSCGFQALLEEHVYGELRDAGGIVQQLTRDTHFAVVLGVDGTVTATPLAGMVVTHGQVRFHRLTPALKDVDFINLSSYSAAIHDYYYASGAMRDAELRRDLGSGAAGALDVTADAVSYPGGSAGLAGVSNVRQGLDALAARGLRGLPDVDMAPGPAVDQYRVVYNHSSGKFVLAPQTGSTGAEVVALINTELGGTTWQTGGGGGAGGEVNVGSNVGTGGALGVYKAKAGLQLQFYGFRGLNGIAAQLNAATNSIDYSLDLAFGDARYVRATQLDDVAFTGAYASLSGLPILGSLSAKNLIAFVDIVATAIASLAEAQAGAAPDKLMTAQRVRDAIAVQAIAATRQVVAGNGLIGGGDMSADRAIGMGTPGTISAITNNAFPAGGGHTHHLAIGADDVIPTGIGAIGSYALMVNVAGAAVGQGGNVAGSSLRYVSFITLAINSQNNGAAGGGTWRNMGNTCPTNYISLFVRIA
jgi:hypothetical protein